MPCGPCSKATFGIATGRPSSYTAAYFIPCPPSGAVQIAWITSDSSSAGMEPARSSIGVGPIAQENRAERGVKVMLKGLRPSEEKRAAVPPACVQIGFQSSRGGIEHSDPEKDFRTAFP